MGKDISKVGNAFLFCDGGSCRKAGSELAIREARAHLKNKGVWNEVHTIKTRCNGRCEDAPTWIVQPGNFWYKNLNPEKAVEILDAHLHSEAPLSDYLLYQPGWEKPRSAKERQKEPVSFKTVKDLALGEILLARMGSSEQDLYPLFQFIFARPEQIVLQLADGESFCLNAPAKVDYTDVFEVLIQSDELRLQFAIAPLPQDVPEEIAKRKIGVTEIFQCQEGEKAGTAGIRFKNRKGKELLTIWLKEPHGEIWRHILLNFLGISEVAVQL